MYDWLFISGSSQGLTFAAGVAALFACVCLFRYLETRSAGSTLRAASEDRPFHMGECILILTLLALPVLATLAAKFGHGGMVPRYTLAAVLGCALALGHLIGRVPAWGRIFALLLFMGNYGLFTAKDILHLVRVGTACSEILRDF